MLLEDKKHLKGEKSATASIIFVRFSGLVWLIFKERINAKKI